MNCEEFQNVAADLARDQKRTLMDAGARAAAQAHVADCQNCAQELLDQINLSEGFRGLAQHMKSWQAPAALEAQVLASFRNQKRMGAGTSQPQSRRYWAVAAAAALLLVVFGLWGMWMRRSQGTSPPQALAVNDSKSAPAPDAKLPGSEQVVVAPLPTAPVQVVAPKNVAPRRYRSSPNRLTAKLYKPTPLVPSLTDPPMFVETVEIATAFVPVGYGSALDLQDGGQLVRVELPRFALARFGLPMNMDRADETIKADVLLGADGLARAIRFVK
ncbi:MAG: hypothetical protein QOD75_234 [Blastocatellia bacterium]|jgi:hypothetical protein|nr:hypothetical protein [Blastocatellia bacterium]